MTDQIQGEVIHPRPPAERIGTGDASAPESSMIDPMWQLVKRLPRYAKLSAALARDVRVPAGSKAMLAAGGAYLLSPIDFVPGFIPVAGQLDDLYVVLLGLRGAIRSSPPEVIDEHFTRIGLPVTIVDDDLAAIRAFVRRGLRWSIHRGGKAVTRLSKEAVAFAQRTRQGRHDRQKRKNVHDQDSRPTRPPSPES